MTLSSRRRPHQSSVIFDVLYGFVPVTEWEEKIIDSPLFQRLRWIKQLGFANYIFPGAEHNRFAHAIGVMHSMDQMIRSLGLNVPDHELFNPRSRSQAAMLHKSLRVAALLHDIGTFPFSHAIENAYIRHGNDTRDRSRRATKDLPNSHEHLGSFLIKNTNYDGGLTRILNAYGFDVRLISKIIKGESPHFIANQLMHSDLDADRMDYLIRDSHYTGIKYGQFDREYILANLVTYRTENGELAFGVGENAMYAIEDFLIARFSWYSQIIRNQDSAKFDIMAAHITEAFLEEDLMHQFHDLLQMVVDQDDRFFWWNDVYFMSRCQEIFRDRSASSPRIRELTEMLLYRKAPKTVTHPLFAHRILPTDSKGLKKRAQLIKQIRSKTEQFQNLLNQFGKGNEWLLVDIPKSDIGFTKDPVRIVSKTGRDSPLHSRENTIMKHLAGFVNFIPSVYANREAIELLKHRRALED